MIYHVIWGLRNHPKSPKSIHFTANGRLQKKGIIIITRKLCQMYLGVQNLTKFDVGGSKSVHFMANRRLQKKIF